MGLAPFNSGRFSVASSWCEMKVRLALALAFGAMLGRGGDGEGEA